MSAEIIDLNSKRLEARGLSDVDCQNVFLALAHALAGDRIFKPDFPFCELTDKDSA